MFGRNNPDHAKAPESKAAQPSAPEPKRKLEVKIADLTWEIAKQPGSGNFRLFHESGESTPVNDVNTILLWEILRALKK
jgi:hypothetical protein